MPVIQVMWQVEVGGAQVQARPVQLSEALSPNRNTKISILSAVGVGRKKKRKKKKGGPTVKCSWQNHPQF